MHRLVLVAACACAAFALAPTAASANQLPSRSKCAGQQNIRAAEPQQEHAMRCLINHVRKRAGAGGVKSHRALERAAGRKAGDVSRCGFSHSACGKPADSYAHKYGYSSGTSGWQWGENLAWGKGKRGNARNVVQAWLNSPPHRSTMLRGSFEHLGIGLRRKGDRAVWALQLGCRGC
jgi:uncharacterized protein YkwD